MKLFGDFEVVRFPEENLIFVTHNAYIYYIYNPKYKSWKKYRNAGNDQITVRNYQEISRLELVSIMDGKFPEKETDFMRLCSPVRLRFGDMVDLLDEDYPRYMSDYELNRAVCAFLYHSNIRHISYTRIKELFDNALSNNIKNNQILTQIKKLSLDILEGIFLKRRLL